LQPDLVLTQELCTVCAVGTHEVRHAVASLPGTPRVVSLEPRTLHEVLDTILLLGRLTGTLRRATEVFTDLSERLEAVQNAVRGRLKRRVLALEWLDPVFAGGHWVPEMIDMAGGIDVLGVVGEPSRQVGWDEIHKSAPEVAVCMPCGFGLERTRKELSAISMPQSWSTLPAVQQDSVFVVDGSSYFNRPGPRLIDGVEILATILHPDAFSKVPPHAFERYSSVASIPVV
jgi:iron complex transport system substrate-binding protein